jgi:hypothetical protein
MLATNAGDAVVLDGITNRLVRAIPSARTFQTLNLTKQRSASRTRPLF